MNEIEKFNQSKEENIEAIGADKSIQEMGVDFLVASAKKKYSYHFTWMGRPIIAYPQDMIAMQELIWEIKPDLIIETGVAHGGSIIYYASLLELIGGDGLVVGIDIEIRKHNRELIEAHPMFKRIQLIEGSSVDANVVNEVAKLASTKKKVMVCLDSNHTHDHVLEELKNYAPLVSVDSYCVVFDTVVEDMPADYDWGVRTWGRGNNPKTAVMEYLKTNDQFEINKSIDYKLLISVAPDGYLKKIK
ncbi:MAG TPA: cephalosporin hydroxylase family protein [Chitinophagaceae bacterium]|nr:cephalosporin hydroxylase family protein [Chitinophagaceae bacterium]